MTNQYDGSFTQTIMDLAARSEGVSSAEIAARFSRSVDWASTFLGRLVRSKGVISAKLGHRTGRYFTRQADADRWMSTATRPQSHKYTKRALTIGARAVYADAGSPPALLPGEPVIPKGVKIQRCPSPPPRFETVPLLTDRPPVGRTGSEDFKQHKSRGF